MSAREDLPLHIVAPTFDPATVGGAGVVLLELVEQFRRRLSRIRIYLNPGAAELFPQWREEIVPVPVRALRGARPSALDLARWLVLGSKALPARSAGLRWYPFGFATPVWSQAPAVATIHDTLDYDLPHTLPLVERTLRRLSFRMVARHARIVTISNFSRIQIHRHYGVEAQVIPHAPVLLPPPRDVPPSSGRAYVFYPANSWPHKNHRFLLDLWRNDTELRDRFELVFTLGHASAELEGQIAAARNAGAAVRVTGYISKAELASLYAGAHCLAFPSTYEGFGLPVAEALQLGCPALISDRTALPETVPPDYPFILPLDPARWKEALLSEPRQRVPEFRTFVPRITWEEVAERYLAIFRQMNVA